MLIPYIGAAVVTIPIALIAFFQFGWGWGFGQILIAYAIIQALDGNLLVTNDPFRGALVEGGHDQQHAVGAHQPGIADVAQIDGEVLSQYRHADRRARGLEVVGSDETTVHLEAETLRFA